MLKMGFVLCVADQGSAVCLAKRSISLVSLLEDHIDKMVEVIS